jgi:hypothetical protein
MEEKELREYLIEEWGEAGERVLAEVDKIDKVEMTVDDFLGYCYACGGNWGAMLLSGIKELWSQVWDAIPENMGRHAWICLNVLIKLCGVKS